MKRYNAYRKRSYNLSKTKVREYSQQMDELFQAFNDPASPFNEWSLSTKMDSCYKTFDEPNIKMRLSNHSANNQYHEIYEKDQQLLVNIKSSKLMFVRTINEIVPNVLEKLNTLDLTHYRFINVVNNTMHCFYEGYKTKKDTIPMY